MAGKVVLVAGGTGGLGRAVSSAFIEDGARVVVTFRRPGDLDELKKAASVRLVETQGASLEGYAVDVTDETAVAKLMDGIVERHRRLDCLVNAVGGYAGGVKLWEMEAKAFEQQLALNLRSGFVLAKAAASDGEARKRRNRERDFESRGRTRCGSVRVCRIESGGGGYD